MYYVSQGSYTLWQRQMKPANLTLAVSLLAAIIVLALAGPALAYHPLNTDDPGTTEYGHFELEWGNDLVWPEDSLEEVGGCLAIKAGLAPGLEFDTALSFFYYLETEDDDSTSGWGDVEMALKYRFLGDGDGPFNLGIEAIGLFPSGEPEKDMTEGDLIVPTTFLFGSAGQGPVRFLFNAGVTFVPEEDDVAIYGAGIEWAASEDWTLVADVYGETDFDSEDENDPLECTLGAVLAANEWLTLSAGAAIGLAPDSPDYRFTFATLVGW